MPGAARQGRLLVGAPVLLEARLLAHRTAPHSGAHGARVAPLMRSLHRGAGRAHLAAVGSPPAMTSVGESIGRLRDRLWGFKFHRKLGGAARAAEHLQDSDGLRGSEGRRGRRGRGRRRTRGRRRSRHRRCRRRGPTQRLGGQRRRRRRCHHRTERSSTPSKTGAPGGLQDGGMRRRRRSRGGRRSGRGRAPRAGSTRRHRRPMRGRAERGRTPGGWRVGPPHRPRVGGLSDASARRRVPAVGSGGGAQGRGPPKPPLLRTRRRDLLLLPASSATPLGVAGRPVRGGTVQREEARGSPSAEGATKVTVQETGGGEDQGAGGKDHDCDNGDEDAGKRRPGPRVRRLTDPHSSERAHTVSPMRSPPSADRLEPRGRGAVARSHCRPGTAQGTRAPEVPGGGHPAKPRVMPRDASAVLLGPAIRRQVCITHWLARPGPGRRCLVRAPASPGARAHAEPLRELRGNGVVKADLTNAPT